MTDFEIIVVGAGPSGSATALQLAHIAPDLAERVLLLDKAIFPRSKLCAGGMTKDAELILRQLGLSIDLPSIPIHMSKFVLPNGSLTYRQPSQFRIIRRIELDHYLFQTAGERGIVTQEGEVVESMSQTQEGVIVRTSKSEYRTKILIGADGANSTVRKLLKLPRGHRLMMALEIFVPSGLMPIPTSFDNMALFDFSLASNRFPGYFWILPSVQEDRPVLSMGAMEAPFHENEFRSLRNAFAQWLLKQDLDLNSFNLQAHPALRYEPRASCSQHGVLLVGDAAGIDPLFGEGITSALALGIIAAESALNAIRKGDFSFSDYQKRIHSSFFGTLMRRRCFLARRLYAEEPMKRQNLRYDALFNWVAPIAPEESSGTLSWESLQATQTRETSSSILSDQPFFDS